MKAAIIDGTLSEEANRTLAVSRNLQARGVSKKPSVATRHRVDGAKTFVAIRDTEA